MSKIKCEVETCENSTYQKQRFCCKHYRRWQRHGNPAITLKNRDQDWFVNNGYIMLKTESGYRYEHIMVAEKALGRPLPPGAEVHHVNEKRWDNYTPYNLVICPDKAYHTLIHNRMRGLGYGSDN